MAAGDPGHYIQCYSTNTATFNYSYNTASDGNDGDVELHKDTDTFSHSTSSAKDTVTVLAAGHYLISHNCYLDNTDLTSYFSPMVLWEYEGSWEIDYGWGSTFANAGSGSAFSGCGVSSATIKNCASSDTIRFLASEIYQSTGDAALVSGTQGWTVLKLDDTWPYFIGRTAAGNDDITVADTDSTWTNITFTDAITEKDTGYTHSTSSNAHEITFDDPGTYLVLAQIQVVNSSGAARKRTVVVSDMALDGSHVSGTYASHYIRNYPNGAFDEGWINMEKLVKTSSSSEKLSLRIRHENSTAASQAEVWGRSIAIVKLPSTADYLRISNSANIETNTAANFTFNTNTEVDSGSFAHSTSSNTDRITATQDQLALFIFHSETDWTSDPSTGEDAVVSGLVWAISGTDLTYGHTAITDRGYTGATELGHHGGRSQLMIVDMANTEYLTIGQEVWGNSEANCEHQGGEITLDAINMDTAFNPPAAGARRISMT